MGRSVADKYTKEERIEMIKNTPVNRNRSKLSEYLSQDNVKCYNRTLVDTAFKRPYNQSIILQDLEKLEYEICEYFKLCDKYDIIPTVSNCCLYVGIHRDTFYDNINKGLPPSDILKRALVTIQSYQEPAVLSGEIPAVPFIFTAKNYFGLKDNNDININQTLIAPTNSNNTMKIIQEQLAIEDENSKN